MNANFLKEKQTSGCGVIGIMDKCGEVFSGEDIMKSIACMRERSNGLGGGFAAYGIYPDFRDFYAFHIMYETERAKNITEEYLKTRFTIEKDEKIPTRDIPEIKKCPILWRYFLKTKQKDEHSPCEQGRGEEDYVVDSVMYINSEIQDAFVASSGKNMGIFKGVGYPEDIGRFFKLEEYKAYIWTAHGRFPTNSVAWWGGAHPFSLLDWSVVHNGEISSYGINKRFLLNYGYRCTLFTDTEVITYLFDLLVRRHSLNFETAADILASPFWAEIDREKDTDKKNLWQSLRIIYGGALVNGPFAVIVASNRYMVGLNDRIKLRPLVSATKNNRLYISSEESAIREVCPLPDKVWSSKAGEPVIGRLNIPPKAG